MLRSFFVLLPVALAIPACSDPIRAVDGGADVAPREDASLEVDAPSSADAAADVRTVDAPRADAPIPDGTLTFAISTSDVPPVTPADEAVGFDLDGMVSDGTDPACTGEYDFVSPISGMAGVDAQMAANFFPLIESMLPDGVVGAVEQHFAASGETVVLEVSGIDDILDDDAVQVHAWTARTGGLPDLGPDGRFAPGQTFAMVSDLGSQDGSITGGRLSTALGAYPFAFDTDSGTSVIPVTDLRLEADLSTTGLTRGEAGGRVSVADLVTFANDLGIAVDETTIRSVVHPDLDEAGSECQSASMGFTFEAVPAVLP